MKVLITGGLGFLGSNVAAACAHAGHDVRVLDNGSRFGAENRAWLASRAPAMDFVPGDIRNRADVDRAVGSMRPDAVFHFAGQVAMAASLADPVADFETNALGTLNVLEALRLQLQSGGGAASLFYSSTNKVYGDLEWVRWAEMPTRHIAPDYPEGFNEQLPLELRTPYGCSKGSADQMILDYTRRVPGLHATVFRHSSMYGPRQFATETQGWIGWFCMKAYEASIGQGTEFTVSGDGKQVRDLLHADDMVNLYLLALASPQAVSGRPFNVGGGMQMSLSVNELLARLESMVGRELAKRHIDARSSDQKSFVADTAALTLALGWRPLVGVEAGLQDMLAWCAHVHDDAP